MTNGALSSNAQKLLEEIGKNTNKQGSNPSFKTKLALSDEDYNKAKDELLESGKIAVYQCYGGGIRLVKDTPLTAPSERNLEAAIAKETKAVETLLEEKEERDLYPYVQQWALNKAEFDFVATVGDNHPRKPWENPDLIAINYYDLQWHVGQHIEVATIEVKLVFNIYAIWQTAHYRRFSHYVYLACYENRNDIQRKEDGRLLKIANELGIGIIAMRQSGHAGTGVSCEAITNPVRQSPQIYEVDMLLNDYAGNLEISRPGKTIIEQMKSST